MWVTWQHVSYLAACQSDEWWGPCIQWQRPGRPEHMVSRLVTTILAVSHWQPTVFSRTKNRRDLISLITDIRLRILHDVEHIYKIQGLNVFTINTARPITMTISKLWHCNFRMIICKLWQCVFRQRAFLHTCHCEFVSEFVHLKLWFRIWPLIPS